MRQLHVIATLRGPCNGQPCGAVAGLAAGTTHSSGRSRPPKHRLPANPPQSEKTSDRGRLALSRAARRRRANHSSKRRRLTQLHQGDGASPRPVIPAAKGRSKIQTHLRGHSPAAAAQHGTTSPGHNARLLPAGISPPRQSAVRTRPPGLGDKPPDASATKRSGCSRRNSAGSHRPQRLQGGAQR
jgi:hypothetical protein